MPKWEYMHVRAEAAKGMWRPRYINGQETSDWKRASSMEVFISEMGEQEWELVTFCPFWSTRSSLVERADLAVDFIQLIFKRPK